MSKRQLLVEMRRLNNKQRELQAALALVTAELSTLIDEEFDSKVPIPARESVSTPSLSAAGAQTVPLSTARPSDTILPEDEMEASPPASTRSLHSNDNDTLPSHRRRSEEESRDGEASPDRRLSSLHSKDNETCRRRRFEEESEDDAKTIPGSKENGNPVFNGIAKKRKIGKVNDICVFLLSHLPVYSNSLYIIIIFQYLYMCRSASSIMASLTNWGL